MSKTLDDIVRAVGASLPPGIKDAQQDLEKHVQAAVTRMLNKLDLVTREEFDVQHAVLARTREKLEAMEQRVAALEAQLLDRD